jgi:hypothetical protein
VGDTKRKNGDKGIMGIKIDMSTAHGQQAAIELANGMKLRGTNPVFEFSSGKAEQPKTDAQRSAIHIWFRQVAEVLNDAGLDKRVVIEKLSKRGIDMPWTESSVKADIYKPIFQVVHDKKSTEDAGTTDHDKVYHGLVKWFGQEFGVPLPPFPSRENEGLSE